VCKRAIRLSSPHYLFAPVGFKGTDLSICLEDSCTDYIRTSLFVKSQNYLLPDLKYDRIISERDAFKAYE